MAVTAETMITWCRRILGADSAYPKLAVEQYLKAIPRLEALADVPRGTPVLVRGDVDAKPGAKIGEGDIRLRSMLETLNYGRQKGWVQIIFGHIGRKPEGSLEKVRARLAELLKCEVGFIEDWIDPASGTVKDAAAATIRAAARAASSCCRTPASTTWSGCCGRPSRTICPSWPVAGRLADECADKVARVYVNEAFSAGSLDASTVVVPAAMQRVALGRYLAEQFDGWLTRLPGGPDGGLQRTEGRQARRHGGHDQPRQDPLGDLGRLAGDGPEEGGRGTGRQGVLAWAWPKIRPMPTSPTTFPATAWTRPRK